MLTMCVDDVLTMRMCSSRRSMLCIIGEGSVNIIISHSYVIQNKHLIVGLSLSWKKRGGRDGHTP